MDRLEIFLKLGHDQYESSVDSEPGNVCKSCYVSPGFSSLGQKPCFFDIMTPAVAHCPTGLPMRKWMDTQGIPLLARDRLASLVRCIR